MAKKLKVVKEPKVGRVPARAAAKASAPKKAKLAVSVDYPLEGEPVKPGHYSIRITASAADQAQARVDGVWLDCREAVGHFWLDWAPRAGAVSIEARARKGKGRWTAAPLRACVVEA